MGDIALSVSNLELWRDGNGKPGAAAMLADHEKRIAKTEECGEKCTESLRGVEMHYAMEEQLMMKVVRKAMVLQSKSKEGMIRAFGPYVTGVMSLVSAIIVAYIAATLK
jgi:hypothetical protein